MNEQGATQVSEEIWMALDTEVDGIQVRKMAGGLYMIRRGEEGTAIAITESQLQRIIEAKAANTSSQLTAHFQRFMAN